MAIEKLKFVNIMGPLCALDDVIGICYRSGSFHAENAPDLIGGTRGFAPVTDHNPYTEILTSLDEIFAKCGLPVPPPSDQRSDVEDLSHYVQSTYQEISRLIERRDKLSVDIADDEQILKQVAPLSTLAIPLEKIFSLEYIKFRFGRMTRENYNKLIAVDTSEEMYVFLASSIQQDFVWGMYFTPRCNVNISDATFSSLHFERIRISDRAEGTPAEVYQIISKELASCKEEIVVLEKEIAEKIAEVTPRWNEVYSYIKYQTIAFDCRKSAMRTESNFYLGGWIPAEQTADFTEKMEHLHGVSCISENPDGGKTLPEAPTRLHNWKVFKPFELFVKMYGLPRYGEFDPTPLVAITYCILFGLMFGDVGQGLVLFLAGIMFWKWKKNDFGKIIATVGVFATLGGFLYGSVFGYENLLPGFRPLEDTSAFNISMFASVGFGIFLIILCIVINIVNGLRRHNIEDAVFGSNGIMGLVFYVSVIYAVVLMLGFGKSVLTIPYIVVFVALPLLAVFLREPLSKLVQRRKDFMPKNKGEFVLENFFELFDVLLSYITNTISFVRIGAFALNHAGMMMFVFILARMSGGSENLMVVVLGNIIVIGLEGLIVGIQVLRLQFYEMFSRFFTGEGREFSPLGKIVNK